MTKVLGWLKVVLEKVSSRLKVVLEKVPGRMKTVLGLLKVTEKMISCFFKHDII
ncbi:hypothetical protein Hdeb2414_s0004g00148861 [Helianthus debilis subsp. tardiflorus]